MKPFVLFLTWIVIFGEFLNIKVKRLAKILWNLMLSNSILSDPSPIIALPCKSVTHSSHYCCLYLTDVTMVCEHAWFTQHLLYDVELNCWICQSWYVDLLKFLRVFGKVLTWICRCCYMNLFKGCCMDLLYIYFSPFAKQNQAEVWFQSFLMLLLWTKGVDWVKAFNALGLLCLWQCLKCWQENSLKSGI